MRAFIFSLALVCCTLVGTAAAQSPVVTVSEPWVRATVAQQMATGAFMRLSASHDARLVAASSPVAGVTEIHEMSMVNDVMRMRAVAGLDLPAGRTVELRPGGYHVMLMDLRQPLNAGERVAITLVFEDRAQRRFTQQVEAPVRALGMGAAAGHGHGGGGMGAHTPPAGHGGHGGHGHGGPQRP
ncbi:copper chaperone PCu(A)C [Serpentinimonas barnesii]|uniref:copper chaperone PCu(A)C n=1 Tax=Serpentinimonas barnesii TaxID=1458427 RepID=UPI0009716C65|nr:copper chaperone PCu(A)C [Serpentinimonas barnesii]